MKSEKEKLVEIFNHLEEEHGDCICGKKEWADSLIDHGVTVPQWIPASEPPETDGKYICRYIFGDHYDMPFIQILDYYATDKNPHFQHEGVKGMKVTHWMLVPHDPMEKGL